MHITDSVALFLHFRIILAIAKYFCSVYNWFCKDFLFPFRLGHYAWGGFWTLCFIDPSVQLIQAQLSVLLGWRVASFFYKAINSTKFLPFPCKVYCQFASL